MSDREKLLALEKAERLRRAMEKISASATSATTAYAGFAKAFARIKALSGGKRRKVWREQTGFQNPAHRTRYTQEINRLNRELAKERAKSQ